MGRPRSYDRDEVLDRATRLFWERGYEGTHLQALVEATGVNRFSLYAEFGGKEGLFHVALERYIESLSELTATLEARPLGLANLRRYYEALLATEIRHGCLALNTLREKHLVPEPIYARAETFTRDLEQALLRNLRAARKRGELGPQADPLALAQLLTALDIGIMTYGIYSPDPQARERMVRQIERLLR